MKTFTITPLLFILCSCTSLTSNTNAQESKSSSRAPASSLNAEDLKILESIQKASCSPKEQSSLNIKRVLTIQPEPVVYSGSDKDLVNATDLTLEVLLYLNNKLSQMFGPSYRIKASTNLSKYDDGTELRLTLQFRREKSLYSLKEASKLSSGLRYGSEDLIIETLRALKETQRVDKISIPEWMNTITEIPTDETASLKKGNDLHINVILKCTSPALS